MADESCVNPQLENGHFHIANELFEAIISKTPWRIPEPVLVFLAVMRETYGFNRKSAEISTERFKKLTGMKRRQNVYRAIKKAEQSKMISVIRNDYRSNATYSIQKRYSKWCSVIKNDYVIKNDTMCNQKRLRRVSKMIPHCILKTPSKDTIKDTLGGGLTKKRRSQLPEGFALSQDLKEFALKNGINGNRVESVFCQFCDHHRSRGNLMLDWSAAWRTWVRNEKKFNRGGSDDIPGFDWSKP
jgi:phage replication O-like protein O